MAILDATLGALAKLLARHLTRPLHECNAANQVEGSRDTTVEKISRHNQLPPSAFDTGQPHQVRICTIEGVCISEKHLYLFQFPYRNAGHGAVSLIGVCWTADEKLLAHIRRIRAHTGRERLGTRKQRPTGHCDKLCNIFVVLPWPEAQALSLGTGNR